MENGKHLQTYKFETGMKMTRKTKNTRKDERSWKEPKY